ncbi:MAG: S-layer homology domain-containing protein [Candidatus Altimarinota bacterium]
MKKFHFLLSYAILIAATFTNITFAYSDVNSDHPYSTAIDYLTEKGLTKGYADGTFRPDYPINRAEFIKIVLEAKFPNLNFQLPTEDTSAVAPERPVSSQNEPLPETPKPTSFADNCFTDVKATDWFSPYICYAKQQKISTGYEDETFKPQNIINIAEASKILVNVLGDNQNLSEGKEWYTPFLNELSRQKYLPTSIKYLNEELNRSEVAEIIYRMMAEIHDQPSTTTAALETNFCQKSPEDLPDNIDMQKVRSTWLKWYNDARAAENLPAYTYNSQLDRTAIIWSEYSEKQGTITHTRPGQTAYYDYNRILQWFKNLDVTFASINGSTYTENIGWNYYNCPASNADCTDQLISSIRSTFDFFMSEKGKAYTAHYDSIMHRNFKIIGLGISVDPVRKKYYLTVHYGTAITSNPPAICD